MRVAVVDDSIIRTTTSKHIIEMLREAGASEIHLRIASPPYKWPCFYGMNTGNIDELAAASMSVEAIRQEVGADSLEYLTIEGLQSSLGQALGKVCMACMTGQYPTPVPRELISKQNPDREN
jgi:amidophosphoribosyltransferase